MTPQSPNEALQPEAPPPPPPRKPRGRRKGRLSAVSGFFSFLVIAAVGALAALAWGNSRLHEPGPLEASKIVYILPHTDLPDIIDKLNAEGVIDSPVTMNFVLTAERKRAKVKAGEFQFKQHASLREVIDLLVSGRQYLHAFTVPEGLTTQQIVQRIRDSDLLSGEIRDMPKEGALLPETYKVSRGTTRSDLLIRMQEDNRKMVDQVWLRRAPDLPLRSPFDLVTLASIVEKETGRADERPRVAAVFVNRLRKHMRLQSDPTIVYGLVGGQGTLGHSITRSELDKRTSYNTYQVDGLPPGPITNPGRAALEAVANPLRTSDLYFVADGTGGHAFAETVEEHNRNVGRWREIERSAKDKSDVDKLSPNAVSAPPAAPAGGPPARGNQRSDADGVFGTLPTRIASVSAGPAPTSSDPTFMDPAQNHDIASVFAAGERGPAPEAARRGRKPTAMPDPASFAAGVDGLALSLDAATAAPAVKGSAILDGPATPAPAAAPATPPAAEPAAPVRAAAIEAKPPAGRVDLFAEPEGTPVPVRVASRTPPLHPKIYDVSQGTALDPLRNTSYDLNSAKAIPADLLR